MLRRDAHGSCKHIYFLQKLHFLCICNFSVGMNTYISGSVRARAIKFGDNIYC